MVMNEETPRPLDAEALALFARKGREGGPDIPQAGLANGVKVRRIMQLTRDLGPKPFSELRILDLGCGEGVYAIEAGLRGAEVVAVDARSQRMDEGRACAERHGLDKVRFLQQDVRQLTRERLGRFDVVYFLGLLYHLDETELLPALENAYDLCGHLLLIDTLISLDAPDAFEWRGHRYVGQRCREHGDTDPPEVRRGRLLRSIDSTFAFRLSRESLLAALHQVGFTSVCECHVPFEPGKARDRITLAARRGSPVRLSTYPWVNDRTEAQIERELEA
jgi:SAM-dependent methyltransferase